MSAFAIQLPYLLFLGNEESAPNAKTAFGLRDWRPDACVAQWRLSAKTVDLGLPDMHAKSAKQAGAKSLLIGVAPFGGAIDAAWIAPLKEAIEAGLDIVSGMHTRLESIDELRIAAEKAGTQLINVRHPRQTFPVGTGVKRSGKRLLTVGTDCALGKKYTALALTKALNAAGHDATFRATGQTGIMISGSGIAIDAIVSDFIAGAAELLSPNNADTHWDIVEGQGSLLHPAYAGVSLGLLHGSQPDVIVLCHDTRRTEIDRHPNFKIPDLEHVIDLNITLGRRTNPNLRCAAISLNTYKMSEQERVDALGSTQLRYGLPTFDPFVSDLKPIVKAIAG
jgi:uncharacterized NAD-dependent epimerase/dehydratase family protein